MSFFSQKKSSAPARYSYTLTEKVRSRIFHAFRQHQRPWMGGGQFDFPTMLHQVGEQVLAKHGSLFRSGYEAAQVSDDPVINHFVLCSDEQAIEFVVMCFHADTMGGDSESARMLVTAVNRIFEEEGIGYELTPPSTIDLGRPGMLFGRPAGRAIQIDLPKIIRKDERTVHEKVVQPALEALRDARLATANSEMLNAFEEVRNGKYADAITSCGASFESVLKTICDVKKWTYDRDKDTCAKLVGICKDHGLFFPFYAPIFEGVGTVRNKLGDAHGKGPKPDYVATREHAEHMIAITCAHIGFLVHQAGF